VSLTQRGRWAELTVRLWLLLGHEPRARRCLDAWLTAEPLAVRALAVRAYLRAQAGDRAGACQDYETLLNHDAGNAEAWFNLGYVRQQAGHVARAAEAFGRAVGCDPHLDRAWYGLGTAEMSQAHWDAAAQALDRACQLQPLSPFAWVQLARTEWRRHRPQAAWRICEHLRGFEPGAAARLAAELGAAAEAEPADAAKPASRRPGALKASA
jgi:Tfp pilus assembly protein PilF